MESEGAVYNIPVLNIQLVQKNVQKYSVMFHSKTVIFQMLISQTQINLTEIFLELIY